MPRLAKDTHEDEGRAVTVTESELLGLAHEVREVFGSGSAIILHYAGFGIGREMAGNVKKPTDKREEVYAEFQDLLKSRGWGTASIETSSGNPESGRVSFSNLLLPQDEPLHETMEMILKGIFSGFMAKAFKTDRVLLEKEKCVAKGDAICAFSFKVEVSE